MIIVGIISDLEEKYVVNFKFIDGFRCCYTQYPQNPQKTLILDTMDGQALARPNRQKIATPLQSLSLRKKKV